MTPRVSVLMTIYNPGGYLKPAVDSLLAQTFPDFELVAIENGSYDGAKDIMRAYAAADPRVRLIDLPENIGRTPALNLALREARAEYVAVLDADDLAHPERLARAVELLDRSPEVVLLASHVRNIDGDGKVTGCFEPPTDPVALRNALAYTNPFSQSACMYRRKAALAVGGYPARFAYAQDFALWLALARQGELAMIPQTLADIRDHGLRASYAAPLAFERYRDGLVLYRSALRMPGLSAAARRQGRATLVSYHYMFAQKLLQSRRPLSALIHFVAAFLTAPGHCLERLWRRVARP